MWNTSLPVIEPLLVGRVQTKHGFNERDDGITWFAHWVASVLAHWFFFWGGRKDEWKRHGWHGFLSKNVLIAWPVCHCDIDFTMFFCMEFFHGVSLFFVASDHEHGKNHHQTRKNPHLTNTASGKIQGNIHASWHTHEKSGGFWGQDAEVYARMRGRQKPSSTGVRGAAMRFLFGERTSWKMRWCKKKAS